MLWPSGGAQWLPFERRMSQVGWLSTTCQAIRSELSNDPSGQRVESLVDDPCLACMVRRRV